MRPVTTLCALGVALLATLASGCPGRGAGCMRNSDCARGSYCSAGACVTDCTAETVEDDCEPGELCNSFGMCVGGATDAGVDAPALDTPISSDAPMADDTPVAADAPVAVDAPPDAPDLRPACVIAGGTDADGDGYCADAASSPDCNDAAGAINPAAAEVCTPADAGPGSRAIDEDCDGAVDDGCGWYFGTPHPVLFWDADAANFGFESPRVSTDALRVYIRGGDAPGGNAVLVLSRPALDMPFAPPAVVSGLGPGTGISSLGISSDEREAYLQAVGAGGTMDTFRSTRSTTTSPFGAFVAVTELNSAEHDYHPFLRADGLEIFFGSSRPGTGGIYRATRTSSSATSWAAPTVVTFTGGTVSGGGNSPALSIDGRTLFFGDAIAGGYSIFIASRTSTDSTAFDAPVEVTALAYPGAFTAFPAVSETSAEIFFVSDRPWTAGRTTGLWRARICRDGPCPVDAIPCAGGMRSPDGHHCYVPHVTPLFQAAASADCVAAGAHLATLHSAAENLFVFGLLTANAWIGARQRAGGTDFDYEWETGEPWSFDSWATAPTVQPATLPGEDWGGYWTGASEAGDWGDWPQVAFGGGLPYVCEIEEWPTW